MQPRNNVPFPEVQASPVMDYVLGFPQATALTHVGTWFPNTSFDLSSRWQAAPSPLLKPQPHVQTEGSPAA